MNISAINIHDNKKPTFTSCCRRYTYKSLRDFNKFGHSYIQTSTNIFREDLDWKKLTNYILNNFADKKRVNSYSLACSDGSEAYSYAISLMEKIPETAYHKFFPIHASDIDPVIIDATKKHFINMIDSELYFTKKNYGIDLNNYFVKFSKPHDIKGDLFRDFSDLTSYKPIQELKNNIHFKRGDILSELSKIKDNGNSVVMCRNVFPYLSDDYIETILNTAEHILKPGSLFIIGDFDRRKDIGAKLLKKAFIKPLDDNNIFMHI